MDIHLLKKRRKSGVGGGGGGGGGAWRLWGGGERGASYERGDRTCLMIYWGETKKDWRRGGGGGGEHGGCRVGENGGGASYERGDRTCLMIYWGGVRTFPPVIMKSVSQTSHYSYNFRLFSFQLKDIHKNNYSSISYYFLSSFNS